MADTTNKRKRSEEDEKEVDEEICTLHLSGFPGALLPRELKNFCRFLPGFTSCSMVLGRSTIGFARFETRQAALDAMEKMTSVQFDEEDAHTMIRASLAKRNLVVRENRQSSSARRSEQNAYPEFMHSASGNQQYFGADNGYYQQQANPYASYGAGYGGGGGSGGRYGGQSSGHRGGGRAQSSGGSGVLECKQGGNALDTLCVRNLGVYASKADLETVFGAVPGYLFMSFLRAKPGANSALGFVRFESEHAASQALQSVHGQPITNCDGMVSVEFARRSLTEDRPG